MAFETGPFLPTVAIKSSFASRHVPVHPGNQDASGSDATALVSLSPHASSCQPCGFSSSLSRVARSLFSSARPLKSCRCWICICGRDGGKSASCTPDLPERIKHNCTFAAEELMTAGVLIIGPAPVHPPRGTPLRLHLHAQRIFKCSNLVT